MELPKLILDSFFGDPLEWPEWFFGSGGSRWSIRQCQDELPENTCHTKGQVINQRKERLLRGHVSSGEIKIRTKDLLKSVFSFFHYQTFCVLLFFIRFRCVPVGWGTG